jgi:glutathione S-transferase
VVLSDRYQRRRNQAGVLKAAVRNRIEGHLAAQGPYLLGAEFSAAGLMLIMLMRWSQLYALEGLTEWA